jgi:AcrR family transcriptional regulator
MAGTSPPPTRSYRGTPAEDRRAQRREQLLAAGLELLGTRGAAGTTVRGVCEEARRTPRYFYESFADLDSLLVAVLDRVMEEASAQMLAALATTPHDARAKARAAIATFAQFVTEDPRRARVCFFEALGNERLMRRRLDTMRLMSALVSSLGREFYGQPADADPIGDVAATMLVGGAAELFITWLDGTLAVSRDQLVDDFAELFVATGEAATAIAARRADPARGSAAS